MLLLLLKSLGKCPQAPFTLRKAVNRSVYGMCKTPQLSTARDLSTARERSRERARGPSEALESTIFFQMSSDGIRHRSSFLGRPRTPPACPFRLFLTGEKGIKGT